MSPPFPKGLMGRSQVVRQRILIPPFGGSIPPAPARQSCGQRQFTTCASQARKCGHFGLSTWSPGSRSRNLRGEMAESLRPFPEKLPFCRDYWRRLVSITTAARPWQPVSAPISARKAAESVFFSTAARGWHLFLPRRPIDAVRTNGYARKSSRRHNRAFCALRRQNLSQRALTPFLVALGPLSNGTT